MRTLLITGPGGSGRTTVAAATALAAAQEGTRTLVLSGDRTDTLGAVLGTPTGPAPTPVAPHLTAWRPDAAAGFRDDLTGFQDRASNVLDLLGASRLDPEEVTPLPGAEELTLLRALRDAALAESHDLLVVDLPPVPQALALLALPEELRRYLRRLLPPERQAARALRPVLGRLAGVPMPAEWLYDTAARWDTELAAVEAVLADRHTAVRLVAEPGPAGTDALRTATLGLALRALPVESLVANRVLPEDTAGPWLAGPVAQQRKALDEWREAHHPVHEIAHLGRDPRGTDDLAALTAPDVNPAPTPSSGPSPTASPRTACSPGTCRCPAPYGTNSTWCGAATNSSSRPAPSAVSSRCPPRCAAAPSTARPCATASCGCGSRRTPRCGRVSAEPRTAVRVTS